MKIATTFVFPPIPDRNSDWMAYDEDTYDGAEDSHPIVGWGPTEEAAKADFMDRWMEKESEQDCARAVRFAKVWDSFLDKIFSRSTP